MVPLYRYNFLSVLILLFFVLSDARDVNSTQNPMAQFSNTAVIASTIVLVLVIVLALLGNTLVCFAFYRSTNLRCVTNVFIVSLAVTDVLVASVSIPIWLIIQNTECINNLIACDPVLLTFWRCLDILFSTASIMNLCAISCDRYIAITSPLRYSQIITKNRAFVALVFLWSYSVIIATINLHGGIYYPALVFVVSFLLPLLVMIYSYSRIFLAALRQVRRVQPIRQAFYFKREIKAAKTLALVMGAFIVCWTPFFVINIIVPFSPGFHIKPIVTLLIKCLHYGNSALNPVIYSSTNRDFRNKILSVLPWKCGHFQSTISNAVVNFWSSSFRSTFGQSSMAFNTDSITEANNNQTHDDVSSTNERTLDPSDIKKDQHSTNSNSHPYVISSPLIRCLEKDRSRDSKTLS